MLYRIQLLSIATLIATVVHAQHDDSVRIIDYGVFHHKNSTLDRAQVVAVLAEKNDPIINRHLKRYKRKLKTAEGLASTATASLGDTTDYDMVSQPQVRFSSVGTGVGLVLWSINKGKKANAHLCKAIVRYNATIQNSGNIREK